MKTIATFGKTEFNIYAKQINIIEDAILEVFSGVIQQKHTNSSHKKQTIFQKTYQFIKFVLHRKIYFSFFCFTILILSRPEGPVRFTDSGHIQSPQPPYQIIQSTSRK